MGDMIISSKTTTVLAQDDKLLDEVINQTIDDPKAMDDLASDIAEEIADNPVFKKKLIAATMGTRNFRKRIIKNLLDELAD